LPLPAESFSFDKALLSFGSIPYIPPQPNVLKVIPGSGAHVPTEVTHLGDWGAESTETERIVDRVA
jgi:hypothetical protein